MKLESESTTKNKQNHGNLYKVNFSLTNEDKIPLNDYPRPKLVRKKMD